MYNDELKAELSLIGDRDIRTFVMKCIEYVPEYFWVVPSSSTGKYHPADENTVGGTVLHTRRMVKVADDLCRMYDVIGIDRDRVLAASIMHDFCKNGYPDNLSRTVAGHGSLWINVATKVMNHNDIIMDDNVLTIGRLIGTHMGRFDIPYVSGRSISETIVQTADYISSREYIKVELNNGKKD